MSAATFDVVTWQTERGWSARIYFFRLEAEGGETEAQAVDEVIGAAYIALGYRTSPPRSVEFVVCQRDEPAPRETR